MTRTASFTTHAANALSRRRTIPIELPEFAIRALEHRVEMTNAGADEDEWCRSTTSSSGISSRRFR